MAALLIAARADPHLENAECIVYEEEEEEHKEDGEEPSKEAESAAKEEEDRQEEGLSPMDMAAGNNRVSHTGVMSFLFFVL